MGTRLDGQLLELEKGGYQVILRKDAPIGRKRFTLAHEIAHTLLLQDQRSNGLPCNGQVECGGPIEELCNVAAAEILIPDRFLRKMFSQPNKVTAKSFLKVSRHFECSLEASGWKLLNSCLVDGFLSVWKLGMEAGRPILKLVAVPRTWGLKIPVKMGMTLDPRHSLWKKLTAEELGVVELNELCPDLGYRGQCSKVGKTILLLVKMGVNYNKPLINKASRSVSRSAQNTLPF